jgi:hypothetical protein
VIFFLRKELFTQKFKAAISVFFFFIVSFYFGQFSARFFFEPILLLTIIITSIKFQYNNNFLLKIFKCLIFIQTALVAIIIWYAIFLINFNSLTKDKRKDTMHNFSFGYSLYNWANSTLPDNSILVTNHGSISLSKRQTIFPDAFKFINLNLLDDNEQIILEIKRAKPNFILLNGSDDNHLGIYKDCVGNLFAKKEDINNYVTRNVFYKKKKDNGYIYEFLYYKLPYCLKR